MANIAANRRIWQADRHLDKLSIILFFAVWEAAPHYGGLVQTFVSPPSQVVLTLWDMLSGGEVFGHAGVSLGRAASGFALAAATGIPLGFLLGGWFKTFERVVNPVLRFLGQVNPFSMFPLFIVLFGIGEVSKTAMVFWVCLWPILFNTITGVKGLDPLLTKSARSMGASLSTLFFRVILPGATPSIFTGLKMGSGTAFFILIAAEMIGASRGLGWLVWNAQINFQIPRLFAATVCISVLGLILNSLFGQAERRLTGWREA